MATARLFLGLCALVDYRLLGNGPTISGLDRCEKQMQDMKAHLERLLDYAAEFAMLSAEADTKEKRELFARLTGHLTRAADEVERAIKSRQPPDAR